MLKVQAVPKSSGTLSVSRNKLGELLRLLGIISVTVTIAIVPWIHGGAIPHAVVVLQVGVVISTIFGMAAVASTGSPAGLPILLVPFTGFAALGLLQQMPIFADPVVQMQHAVVSPTELRRGGESITSLQLPSHVRSLMPAETRLFSGQMVTLALLSVTLFKLARTRLHVIIVLAGLVFSAVIMTSLAFARPADSLDVPVGNHWKISNTWPYGCFVNPNNAAGWLIVCLSSSLALTGMCFEKNVRKPGNAATVWSGGYLWSEWRELVRDVARMNLTKLAAGVSVVVMLGSIAATLSRAGITSALIGLAAFFVSRILMARWLVTMLSIGGLLILSCGLLVLFDLDTRVISELQTLKDPVSESTGRLVHWSDTLSSFGDFPVLGSGMGAYSFASLPYQRRFTTKWFQNADNQYVEILIEGGVVGLLLYLTAGAWALMLAGSCLRGIGSSRRSPGSDLPVRDTSVPCVSMPSQLPAEGAAAQASRRSESPSLNVSQSPSRRSAGVRLKQIRQSPHTKVCQALAGAVICCILALSLASFFDFGISLVSVSSALVTLVVLLENQAAEGRAEGARCAEKGGMALGAWTRVFGWISWLSLGAATVFMIPDAVAASHVYSATVPVERQRNRPDPAELTETGDQWLIDLKIALARRPDDLRGQRSLVLFQEMLFRNDLMRRVVLRPDTTARQAELLFSSLNPVALTVRSLDKGTSGDLRGQLRTEVETSLKKYPWCDDGHELLGQSILARDVGRDLVAMDILLQKDVDISDLVYQTRFAQPDAAPSLYQLGAILMQADRMKEGLTCWQQSLASSESLRGQMLLDLSKNSAWGGLMKQFMPENYEAAVAAALVIPGKAPLRLELFNMADQLWMLDPPRLDSRVAVTRANHLSESGRDAEALVWMRECLLEMPDDIRLRKQRASLLEKTGETTQAYDEWLTVQSLSPSDPDIQKSLERLIHRPPPLRK